MEYVHPAFLVKDFNVNPNAKLSVVFPDLPGCVTQGDAPQHAVEMASEALRLHIESMVEGGEILPEPPLLSALPDWIHPTETEIIAHLLVAVELPA